MNRAQRRAGLAQAASRGSWEWNRVRLGAEDVAAHPITANMVAAWTNDLYSVQRYDNSTQWGLVIQLTIRSHHGRTIPWDDMQRIKDEIAGEAATAVEVYPALEDVVDKAPMRHLWVLPQSLQLPFGLHRDECWGKPR
jgi:hypothetical protein